VAELALQVSYLLIFDACCVVLATWVLRRGLRG
jgi:hypothetical protein